jgi:hypothetical protein
VAEALLEVVAKLQIAMKRLGVVFPANQRECQVLLKPSRKP